MVNPFLTTSQAAASLAQQFLDEEEASVMAGARMLRGYCEKSFDELTADALVEIQAKRLEKAAFERTRSKLAEAERKGTQAALSEHVARVQPAPTNSDGAAPTHGFDLDTITRTQQEMLDDANEVRKLVKESKTLNERHLVYPDYTTPRYRAPQVQPAPAKPQPVKKTRRDLLQIHIDEAVKVCGPDHTKVFCQLREWASEKPPRQPLRGVTEEGIQWVNANDEGKTLGLEALNKRLKRRR